MQIVAGNVETLLFPVFQADKPLREMYKGCWLCSGFSVSAAGVSLRIAAIFVFLQIEYLLQVHLISRATDI